MDPILLVLVAVALVAVVALFVISRKKTDKPDKADQRRERPAGPVAPRNAQVVGGVRRAGGNAARNRLRNRNQANNGDSDDGDYMAEVEDIINNRLPAHGARARDSDDDDDDDGSVDLEDAAERERLRKKVGTKKLAKLEAKEARREQNEMMLREREEKREREEEIYQMRKKKEEEEERKEKEKEELERKLKEEQERKEHEEYLKLKEQFQVEEEGQDMNESDLNSANLLQEFVDYIQKSKMVVLEDLAAEFKLKTQDIINRIQQVEEMGMLTGVMDDRGKYIYISRDELLQVKKFIEQRGRVNIAELAKSSNQLINLKPTNAEVLESTA